MPSAAFIKAASAANRQPVVCLAIESADAIKKPVTTQADWLASDLTDINATYTAGQIRVATDGIEDTPSTHTAAAATASVSSSTPMTYYADNPGGGYFWESYTAIFFSGTRTTGLIVNYSCNVSIANIYLYGRFEGGAWQQLANKSSGIIAGTLYTFTVSGLQRGAWEFRMRLEMLSTVVPTFPSVSVGTYQEIYETLYLSAGSVTTIPIDMESVLTANRFETDDIIPAGCSIAYSAWGRDATGDSWTSLGTIYDGDPLAPYRYYQIKADLTSSYLETPLIDEVRVANSQFIYLSTHKDQPVRGALPYIAPGGISSISSKIDLTQQATVGELTVKLFWRREVGAMIAGDALKNKTIIAKLGFVGLDEVDFEPYFVGTWFDYQTDPTAGTITVKTRNVLKRYARKVPDVDYFMELNETTGIRAPYAPPHTKDFSGNIMQTMLDIADLLGIPDRLINRGSFVSLAEGARSGSDWVVTRSLTEPQDAMEMLNELSVSAGVFLFEGADGRLTAKLYDAFAAAAPIEILDAAHCKFKPVDGGQKDLSTRQAIYHDLIAGKTGGSATDYNKCLLQVNVTAETAWNETNTREWKDKWGLSAAAIQLLAERWGGWFSVPNCTVRVDDVPPRLYGLERGDVVAVYNLQLPCPAEDWPGYCVGTRFLVMGKSTSDPTSGSLTVSFDLMQLEPAVFRHAIWDHLPETWDEWQTWNYDTSTTLLGHR